MKLEKLKDLKDVIALCRKTGVKSIEIDGVKLELNEVAPNRKSRTTVESSEVDEITSDTPTEEQMLFWSAQDVPSPTDN
jgi:hypothetical protein